VRDAENSMAFERRTITKSRLLSDAAPLDIEDGRVSVGADLLLLGLRKHHSFADVIEIKRSPNRFENKNETRIYMRQDEQCF